MPASAIVKVDTERQYVFGWASVALRADGVQVEDSQNDLIDIDDLEEAGYQFALHFRETGVMHEGGAVGTLIESFVATPDKLTAMGLAADALPQAMWVGFHIADPAIFAKVKAGEYSMFSIQGTAYREEVS